MGARENKVEEYLNKEVQDKLKGRTLKWGTYGCPDRVVFLDGGHIYLVEVKTVDGTHTTAQKRVFPIIEGKGTTVFTLYGHADVDDFIAELKEVHGG